MRIFAACVKEYFSEEEKDMAEDKSLEDPIYKGYKAVLDSKSNDETLVRFVSFFRLICSMTKHYLRK